MTIEIKTKICDSAIALAINDQSFDLQKKIEQNALQLFNDIIAANPYIAKNYLFKGFDFERNGSNITINMNFEPKKKCKS